MRLDQLLQRLVRTGARHVVAGHDRRIFGGDDQPATSPRCPPDRDGSRVKTCAGLPAGTVGLLLHDVDRQRHEHRAGRRIVGDLEGALQDRAELVGALDLHAPLGDRRGHRREVVAQHGIAQPDARVLLARRHHHGRVVLERAVDHADARCPAPARHAGSRRPSCRSPGRRSWRRRPPRPHAGARCTGVAGSRAANRAAGSRWCRDCRRCDRRRGPAASRRTPDDRALLHPSKFVAWYGKPMEVVERYRE